MRGVAVAKIVQANLWELMSTHELPECAA
jgi:hypothetical protein